jgi:ATP-dependent DNA helicase 2 subunit 2
LPDTDGDAGAPGFNNLAPVRNARTYRISDETAPGGKRDVDPGTLAKGYEYGRTAVHISESDLNVTRIETELGLSIVGFIPWVNVGKTNSPPNISDKSVV